MTESVSRREFDNLYNDVTKQRDDISSTAVELGRIQANQKHDSKKLDEIVVNIGKISSAMDDKIRVMSKEVTLNKVQLARIVVIITPFNAAIAYAVAKIFVGK